MSVARVCDASICAHGDDHMNVSVSYDGTTFERLSSNTYWSTTVALQLNNLTAPTVLQFEVDDDAHTGGFLATIRLQCNDGYNRTILTDEGNTNFDVVYSLSGEYEMDVFMEFGDHVGTTVNEDTVQCMDPNAVWMWNGINSDDVIFELNLFSDITTTGTYLQNVAHNELGILRCLGRG